MTELAGKRIAVVAASGFEQPVFTALKKRFENGGADVLLASASGRRVSGWLQDDWGDEYTADTELGCADPADYDAVVLPGGPLNVDSLRTNEELRAFVAGMFGRDRVIAATGHAVSLLIDSGLLEGRKMTSDPSLQQDLVNAGARWLDQPVVKDEKILTSRSPDDIDALCEELHDCLIETQPFQATA